MGNYKKEMEARNQGMVFALNYAKEHGVEGLEEEIKRRGISGISLSCSQKEVEEAGERFKVHSIKFSMLIALMTLYEDFKFSNYQGKLFSDKYLGRVTDLAEQKVLITDYIETVKQEFGIEIDLGN